MPQKFRAWHRNRQKQSAPIMEKVNLEQPTKDAEEKARKEKEFKDQYETLIRPSSC